MPRRPFKPKALPTATPHEKAVLALMPRARLSKTPAGDIGIMFEGSKRPIPLDEQIATLKAQAKGANPEEAANIKLAVEYLNKLSTDIEPPLMLLPPREGRRVASSTQAAKLKAAKRFVDTGSGHFAKENPEEYLSPADRRAMSARMDMAKRERDQARGKGKEPGEIPEGTRLSRLPGFEAETLKKAFKGKLPKSTGRGSLGLGRRLVAGSENIRKAIIGAATPEQKQKIASGSPNPARIEAVVPTPEADIAKRAADDVTRLRSGTRGNMRGDSPIATIVAPGVKHFDGIRRKIINMVGTASVPKLTNLVKAYMRDVGKAVRTKDNPGGISREVANSLRNRMVENLMQTGRADAVLGRIQGTGKYQTTRGAVRSLEKPSTEDPRLIKRRRERRPPADVRRAPDGRPTKPVGPPAQLRELVSLLQDPRKKELRVPIADVPETKGGMVVGPGGELDDATLVRVLRKVLGSPPTTTSPPFIKGTGKRRTSAVVPDPAERLAQLERLNYRGGRTPFKA